MAEDYTAKLRQMAKDSGLSMNAMSRRSGIDRSNLARFIKGDIGMTYENGCRLLELLTTQEQQIKDDLNPAVIAPKPQGALGATIEPKEVKSPVLAPKSPSEALRALKELTPYEKAKRKKLGMDD